MVDSCVEGAGIVMTDATEEELQEEASWAETRGWTATLMEVCGELEEEQALLRRLEDEIPRGVTQPTLRFLHLFSGPPREGDVGWWLRVLGEEQGVRVVVENIDTVIDTSFNLCSDSFYTPLLRLAQRGTFHGIHSGSPCSTWSRARWRRPGPAIMRTRDHPYGGDPRIPALTERDELKLQAHTLLFRRSFAVCQGGAVSVARAGPG